ncbi:MAG: DUF3006 domain-containing protein [Defluviitaleaceae bacterium]|nr:DUF3006 domain-containing protein [Defluviitaleaceae bacterium]
MSGTYVIDRFEGGYAVCEDVETLETINLRKKELPPGAKDGDVIVRKDNVLLIDREQTEERKAKIKDLFEELKRK